MAGEVFLYPGAVEALLHNPAGAVGRDLLRRALKVESQAVRLCPVDTGRLRGSITHEAGVDDQGCFVDIGSNVEYACILGARTPVTTSTGTRTIGQVQPGELVLTQTGEFLPVVDKWAFPVTEKPDLIEIVAPWRSDRVHTLTVTADHKVLAFRDDRLKWVEAGDLTMTDRLHIRRKQAHNRGTRALKVCSHCGTEHRGQGRVYCSQDCRDTAWRAGRNPHVGMKRSAETRAKQSADAHRRLAERPELHPNRIVAQRGHSTDAEAKVATWLDARGLGYEREKPIGRAYADFYVADEHRVYEADGAFWHKDQAKDIERDKRMIAAEPDLSIVHIHFYAQRFSPKLDVNPLPNVHYIAVNPSTVSYVEPDTFVGVEPISLRSYRWQPSSHPKASRIPSLFDLSVEGQHSFLAGGLLVSNSYVELGTSKMAPQAYLRPALEAAR